MLKTPGVNFPSSFLSKILYTFLSSRHAVCLIHWSSSFTSAINLNHHHHSNACFVDIFFFFCLQFYFVHFLLSLSLLLSFSPLTMRQSK